MDQRTATERALDPIVPDPGDPDAMEFVRFCYRRRRVGWPELYDEMCAVVGRGLYRGYDVEDLNRMGIGLTLFEMPTLAALVQRVVAEDQERRGRSIQAVRAAYLVAEAEAAAAVGATAAATEAAESTEAPASPGAPDPTESPGPAETPAVSSTATRSEPHAAKPNGGPSEKRPQMVTVPLGA